MMDATLLAHIDRQIDQRLKAMFGALQTEPPGASPRPTPVSGLSSVNVLAALLSFATMLILSGAIFDALYNLIAYATNMDSAPPSMPYFLASADDTGNIPAFSFAERRGLLLGVALVAVVLMLLVSEGCRRLMRPSTRLSVVTPDERLPQDVSTDDDEQRYLHRALAAGLTGIVLVIAEPLLAYFDDSFRFNFEELLLGSGGLNTLLEEVRLSRQYQSIQLRRAHAEKQADLLIRQIVGFRSGVISAFGRSFGASALAAPDREQRTAPTGDAKAATKDEDGVARVVGAGKAQGKPD